MEWNELSDQAKSVIEWVQNPYTDKRENIHIEVGSYFYRHCSNGDVNIHITKELFDEIFTFVSQDKDLEFKLDNGMDFKIRDDSKLVLL